MKIKLLILTFLLFSFISLFSEDFLNAENYEYLYDQINNNRNYSEPRLIINESNGFSLTRNQNMGDIIYYSLFITKNIPTKYNSQLVVSAIVDNLSLIPESFKSGIYSKIIISEYLSVSEVITFELISADNIKVTILSEKSKNVFVFKCTMLGDKKHIRSLDLIKSSSNNYPVIDKEYINGIWCVFWEKMMGYNFSSLIVTSEKQMIEYQEVNNTFNTISRDDFCLLGREKLNNMLIKIYNTKYKKISSLDYLAINELINRAYVAPM